MDQDIDGQQMDGPAGRAATQEPEADATIGAAERKKEYFSDLNSRIVKPATTRGSRAYGGEMT